MIAVRVMEVSIDQVVNMVAVWHCLMPTAFAMDVSRLMARAVVVRRTCVRVSFIYAEAVLIDMVAVWMMEVSIV